MISTNFKQVLRECARSQGVDPDSGSFTQEYADELAESINSRISTLWTQEFWPFAMKVERRQYRETYAADMTYGAGVERYYNDAYYRSMQTNNLGHTPGEDGAWWKEVLSITADDVPDYVWDPYIALNQSGQTLIPEDGIEVDEFLYSENPSVNRWARPVRDVQEDQNGVHVTAVRYPARPWIRFRPVPPRFTGELYSATISYASGYAVYSPVSGECYKSLVDANLGNAVTDATKWEKQLFPSVFLPVVRLYAKAERLQLEEKHEMGFAMESRAKQLEEKLVDDFFESGSRTRRARVVNR